MSVNQRQEISADIRTPAIELEVQAVQAGQNLLEATQIGGPKSDTAQTPVTNFSASIDAAVSEPVSNSHDLEAFLCGSVLGWGVYRENKKELDPVIDACQRFSMEVNMLPMRSMERMAENTARKPLTTALEFVVFPGLPALHASLSVINDRLK
ncbi:MAG: hypothetical protein C0469_00355 [Cyanobacteria bacterium DS2.3.42]|nr:hypothetical protein [Cyanobacteria bacterium DS2.3.42]